MSKDTLDPELMKVSPALAISKMLMQNHAAEKQKHDDGVVCIEIPTLGDPSAKLDIHYEADEKKAEGGVRLKGADIGEAIDKLAQYLLHGGDLTGVNMNNPAVRQFVHLAREQVKTLRGKRKSLVADEFLHRKLLVPQMFNKAELRQFEAVREHLREARKFVLDETATQYVAEFIRDHPVAIAYDQEFAIPPFPRMYVEISYPKFLRTVNKANDLLLDPKWDDTEVGYFFDGPTVYVLSRMRSDQVMDSAAMIMPICYKLNQPFTVQEELDMCEGLGMSRVGIDLLYWGSSYPLAFQMDANDTEMITHPEMVLNPHAKVPKEMRVLREHHSFAPWYATDVLSRKEMLSSLIKSAAGDLRNAIALLLFLNRTQDVRFDEAIPVHHGFIGPKPAVYMKHHVVRIKLDPKPMLIKTYGSKGVWRRRHEVRGHFCHDKTARANNHHYLPQPITATGHQPEWTEYDINQWRCLVCGGKRWHRKAHERGHKEKGKVQKEYEVTK